MGRRRGRGSTTRRAAKRIREYPIGTHTIQAQRVQAIELEEEDRELDLDLARGTSHPTRRVEQATVPLARDRGIVRGRFIPQPLAESVNASVLPRTVLGQAPGAACRRSARGTKHDKRTKLWRGTGRI